MSCPEVEKNYEWFLKNHDELHKKYGDKTLLLKSESIAGVYDNFQNAYQAAMEKGFEPGKFSIQTLNDQIHRIGGSSLRLIEDMNALAKIECTYEYQNKVDYYEWDGNIYLSNSPIENGFQGITNEEFPDNERLIIGKKEDNRLNFTLYSLDALTMDFYLINDYKDSIYYGHFNTVDFHNKNIKYGGLAQVEINNIEDLKLQKLVLFKVGRWSNKTNYLASKINQQIILEKSNVSETFVHDTKEDAKKLFLK